MRDLPPCTPTTPSISPFAPHFSRIALAHSLALPLTSPAAALPVQYYTLELHLFPVRCPASLSCPSSPLHRPPPPSTPPSQRHIFMIFFLSSIFSSRASFVSAFLPRLCRLTPTISVFSSCPRPLPPLSLCSDSHSLDSIKPAPAVTFAGPEGGRRAGLRWCCPVRPTQLSTPLLGRLHLTTTSAFISTCDSPPTRLHTCPHLCFDPPSLQTPSL